MPNSNGVTPSETMEKAARAETTSRPKREYRTLAFQVALFSALAAFAVLTLMVSCAPSFVIDLQITRALQTGQDREEHTSELQSRLHLGCHRLRVKKHGGE